MIPQDAAPPAGEMAVVVRWRRNGSTPGGPRKLIEDLGVETLMWGSDYPHGDGVWPESTKYIEEQFGHLPAEVAYKITCENAGKFYGLM